MARKAAVAEAPAKPDKGKAKQGKAKAKDTKAKALQVASMPKVSPEEWQEMLDDIGTESNDPRIYFLKNGRTRLRLIPEGNPKNFFLKFTRTYQDSVSTKFLLRGIVMSRKEEGPPTIQVISVGKVVVRQLLNLLTEGYNLFDPELGRGITIVRKGSGITDTSYTTLPSADPVPIPPNTVDLTDSMEDLAKLISDQDAERQKNGNRNGTSRMGKGKRKPEEDEEDTGSW